VKEAYINKKLASNTTYTLTLFNLSSPETTANINGIPTSLIALIGGNIGIELAFFDGTLIIGGYQQKTEVKGIRSQSQSFVILCLQQLSAGWLQLNLSSSSVISANTQESCPKNLCSSQEAITFTSNDSLLAFDILSKVPVLQHSIFMRFRTRAKHGWLFYLGNDQGAHLAAYLSQGYLNVSLNMISSSYSRVSLQLQPRVDTGVWNDLSVKRSESHLDITMNGNLYQLTYTIPGKSYSP